MKLTGKFILSFTLLGASMLACSVYKNQGRKNFESNAPGQIQSFSITATKTMSTSDDTTCWQQPTSDPLWEVDDQGTLTVRKISPDEIEVCHTDSVDDDAP
jgi:hypothetical protein